MNRLLQLAALLAVLLSLSACKAFKKPTVDRVHDLTVASMTPDRTTLLLSVKVGNPNFYKLSLRELNIRLLDKDRMEVGTAKMKARIMIPGGKSTNIDFNVVLDTRRTARMISHADQVVFFYILGEGYGKALGFGKRFEFEEPYELNLKEYMADLIPRFSAGGQDLFRLQRTYISDWGLGATKIRSEFIILNPYGLRFSLRSFPADVFINGRKVGSASLEKPLEFTEDIYSLDGSMLLQVNNFKSILQALGGVVKGEIGYEIRGKVNIDALGMEIGKPYEYKGSIPFDISELLF
jgi:LEA14-like dessication related protein